MLDATVVNVALPRLGADLDAGFGGLQWVVNAYTLTLAAFILLGGSLGDHYGRRRDLPASGSPGSRSPRRCAGWRPPSNCWPSGGRCRASAARCSRPGSLAIIAARSTPPTGPAPSAPGRRSAASPARSGRSPAAGWWSGTGGRCSWSTCRWPRWCCWSSARHVPESRDESAPETHRHPRQRARRGRAGPAHVRPDPGRRRASTPWSSAPSSPAPCCWSAFVLVQRRSDHPLVPLDMFASRQFTAINLVTFATYAALGVFFFLLVLRPAGGGRVLAAARRHRRAADHDPHAAAVGPGRRAGRPGGRPAAADRRAAAGDRRRAADAAHRRRTPPTWPTCCPPCIVFGLGLSTLVAPLTATVLSSAPPGHSGVASGVNNAVARVGRAARGRGDPGGGGPGGRRLRRRRPASPTASAWRCSICAGLLLVGAVLAAVLLRPWRPRPSADAVDLSTLGKRRTAIARSPKLPPTAGSRAGPQLPRARDGSDLGQRAPLQHAAERGLPEVSSRTATSGRHGGRRAVGARSGCPPRSGPASAGPRRAGGRGRAIRFDAGACAAGRSRPAPRPASHPAPRRAARPAAWPRPRSARPGPWPACADIACAASPTST